MLEVSGDYGDPSAEADRIWPLQRSLNQLFERHLSRRYFCKEVETFSIILRVSGKVTDFGGDGPERLKFVKEDKDITIDLVIAMHKWRGVSDEGLRKVVSDGITRCFEDLVWKAKSLGELTEEAGLRDDFAQAMKAFAEMKS